MAIDISSCLPISGWMSELELQWLAEQASKHERIIEVGSWCGRSTRALALHTSGKVWAVDLWKYLHGAEAPNGEEWIAAKDALRQFMANIQDIKHKVNIVQRDSLSAPITLAEDYDILSFDMVFIDGAHDYGQVQAEIVLYRRLVEPGGLLCGHDLGHADVNRAVRELIPDFKAVPDTQLWWKII